jgi:sugar phosphate isomerase/epimerase
MKIGAPFALGLRLSNKASLQLLGKLPAFKSFLDKNDLYVVSVNAFPYGTFHNKKIKKKVYLPDWSSHRRVEFTKRAAVILAGLLGKNYTGTISTVGSHYGKKENPACVSNIIKIGRYLKDLEGKTGKRIILSFEPEPDCYIDGLNSTIRFFNKIFKRDPGLRRYIGVCLDLCHVFVEFEDPLDWLRKLSENKIEVMKIQISEALSSGNANHLAKFADDEYLHQTRVLTKKGTLKFNDLPEALRSRPEGKWRVHCHLPLRLKGRDVHSTGLITKQLFKKLSELGNKHIELETYTYRLLPFKKPVLSDYLSSELSFISKKFQ